MFVVCSFRFFAIHYHNIPYDVTPWFIFSTIQSAISLSLKAKYTRRHVVRLVNIFICLANDSVRIMVLNATFNNISVK